MILRFGLHRIQLPSVQNTVRRIVKRKLLRFKEFQRNHRNQYICSDPYAKFSRWPIGRPIGKAVDPLVYRSTYWPTGTFGVWVNLLAKRSTCWCTGQPIGNVVNQCNKFTMLIPSTKLLIYTLREPLNLFFLLPLCMPFPCHSCCTLSSNCCIGSLSCTQSS
jgi:hypothetical protein